MKWLGSAFAAELELSWEEVSEWYEPESMLIRCSSNYFWRSLNATEMFSNVLQGVGLFCIATSAT